MQIWTIIYGTTNNGLVHALPCDRVTKLSRCNARAYFLVMYKNEGELLEDRELRSTQSTIPQSSRLLIREQNTETKCRRWRIPSTEWQPTSCFILPRACSPLVVYNITHHTRRTINIHSRQTNQVARLQSKIEEHSVEIPVTMETSSVFAAFDKDVRRR
jgi:hypothetical protein